jgi:peptidoglycan/LPS O-acetylase OafA/YrhL
VQGLDALAKLQHSPLVFFIAGHQAVILFFVLSGFVLTLPYDRDSRLDYWSFVLKRICRIYLPYLGALALAVLMNSFYHGLASNIDSLKRTWDQAPNAQAIVQHVVFLGDYRQTTFSPAFWSLIYEMRISLIFPFAAIAILRFRATWMLLCAVIPSLAVKPLFYCIPLLFHGDPSSPVVYRSAVTLHYLSFFMLGALLAKKREVLRSKFEAMPASAVFTLYAIAMAFYFFPRHASRLASFPGQIEDWFIAVGAAVVILLSLNSSPFQGLLSHPTTQYLGKISYSLYLTHGTVLFALVYVFHGVLGVPYLALYLLVSLVLADVFYRLVEEPSMLLGRSFGKARKLPASMPWYAGGDEKSKLNEHQRST